MYFNKEILNRITPPNMDFEEINVWYRDYEKPDWRKNNYWFYKTKQRTIHLVIADIDANFVVLRDFRWDYIKSKWVTGKSKLELRFLDFFRNYWHKNRHYKHYNGSYMYNALVKTEPPKSYAFEMSIRVYRRIQEYSYFMMKLCPVDTDLMRLFVSHMVGDFGTYETIAALCMLNDAVARRTMATPVYYSAVAKARKYMQNIDFDARYYTEDILDLSTMTDTDMSLITWLLPCLVMQVLKI